jgi:hypothetical protein
MNYHGDHQSYIIQLSGENLLEDCIMNFKKSSFAKLREQSVTPKNTQETNSAESRIQKILEKFLVHHKQNIRQLIDRFDNFSNSAGCIDCL